MTTSGRRLATTGGMAVLGLALLVAPSWAPATAQSTGEMTVGRVQFTDDDQTRVVVDLQGVDPTQVDDSAFAVAEDGADVGDVAVVSSSEVSDRDPRSVVLTMDASNSTRGEPRTNSIAAAKAFASLVIPRGVAVGVVAFNGEPELLQVPTIDVGEVEAALDRLPTGGATAVYDGVFVAATTLNNFRGGHTIVVFTDGADTRSVHPLDVAITAAQTAGASVTSVALDTGELDDEALDALDALAGATGGRVVPVGEVGGLGEAFERVAADINSQYVLTYPTTERTGSFELRVEMDLDGDTMSRTITVFRVAPPTAAVVEPEVVAVAPPGALGSPVASAVGIAAAGVAMALLLWALFVPVGDREVSRNLQVAIGAPQGPASATSGDLSLTTAAISRRAIELVERVPRPAGYDASVQARIDRAGWPLRATEFTTMRAILVGVGLALGWSLVSPVAAVTLAAAGWVVPNVVLGVRIERHQAAFMEQLPDTLQLLAGSLKAGYGVLQAIDTVVQEAKEPTKSEFQRVLSEARLGLELEDSLMDMAGRIGADDFRWVAVSISIQRRVGGNLAHLLETVAATLRERESTRRQIRALSAEGRISAVILVMLPFALGGFLLLSNKPYLQPLWTTGLGRSMALGAGVLMVVGVYWMRTIIKIDV